LEFSAATGIVGALFGIRRSKDDRSQSVAAWAAAAGAIGIIGGLLFSALRIYVVEESDERGLANQEFTLLALKSESTLPKGFTEHGYVYFVDPLND